MRARMFPRAVALAAVLFCGWCAGAEPPACYEYSISKTYRGQAHTGTGSSEESACANLASQFSFGANIDPPYWTYSVAHDGFGAWTGETFSCVWEVTRSNPTDGGPFVVAGDSGSFAGGTREAVECPEDSCSELESLPGMVAYESNPAGGLCSYDEAGEYPGGCAVEKSGAGIEAGGRWFGQVRFTGSSCADEPEADEPAPNCISGPDGRVCISKTEQSCGTVNGEAICLGDVPPGTCTLLAGGGAVCHQDAEVQPTTGEPPEAATPTQQIEVTGPEGSATYNYYSSSVVNSSTTVVSGSSGTGGSGGSSGSGSDDGGIGYGDFPGDYECEDLDGCVEAEATGRWESMAASIPLLALAQGLYSSMGTGGTCPSVPASILGEEYDLLASGCDLIDEHGELLALILQCCWSLLALKLLLGGRD